MPSIRTLALSIAFACLFCSFLTAQEKSASDRLAAAHAQYYTPTTSGLKSFHCKAAIDWKSLIERITGTALPDDNPTIKYLQTVQLSVTDELKGNGALEWASSAFVPEGKEQAVEQMREGFQTAVDGFFQSWNPYMNGSMVPIPDKTLTVTPSGEGIHLSASSQAAKIDEDFDKSLLLTQVLVVSPSIKVLATPTYVEMPGGLTVTSVDSKINQPPSAPQTEAIFRIEYANVDTFEIPSRIVLDIKNTGLIDLSLNACQVSVADWARKK